MNPLRVLRPIRAAAALFALASACSYTPGYEDAPLPPTTRADAGTDVTRNPAGDSGPGPDAPGSPPVNLGPTVVAAVAPPPVSGGTLLVLRDGVTAVAADPDRDCVWFVDLVALSAAAPVMLHAGDEPGRIAEDSHGGIHVALRRGGAVVRLDAATHAITERQSVCAAPRGIAYDPNGDVIRVACVGGELVTLPAAGGAPTTVWHLGDDLRDVVIDGSRLVVSRFRSAQLLTVTPDGSYTTDVSPPVPAPRARPAIDGVSPRTEPDVAWRTVPLPGGGVLMLHQRALHGMISTGTDGYAGRSCMGTPVTAAVTTFTTTMPAQAGPSLEALAVAVDIAVGPGGRVAIAAPGVEGDRAGGPINRYVSLFDGVVAAMPGGCVQAVGTNTVSGQPTALAFDPSGRLVVQNREPASIDVFDLSGTAHTIALGATSRADTGQELFHRRATTSQIACASCHPEGGDDGRVWFFDTLGARRTQVVRGGVLALAPFHWSGDQRDMSMLAQTVFTQRMGGGSLQQDQIDALGHWLDAVPELPTGPTPDQAAVNRGAALFVSADLACASCHSGPQFTSNAIVDVGTGGAFKVPSLRGVRWRAPYLHNGCAPTLGDRFGPCGGAMHGMTSGLTAAQVGDLVAYLQTL